MNNAEKQLVLEINNYKKMIRETNSVTRKVQLQRHIYKLEKELKTYRFYRQKSAIF